jgi:hypothetical protein
VKKALQASAKACKCRSELPALWQQRIMLLANQASLLVGIAAF